MNSISPVVSLSPFKDGKPVTLAEAGRDQRWYFLETTALAEVDALPNKTATQAMEAGKNLDGDIHLLVREMRGDHPAEESVTVPLVVFIHGYSNNRDAAISRLAKAQHVIQRKNDLYKDTFWVGYRWPSESSFVGPSKSLITGLTTLAAIVLCGGAVLAWLGIGLHYLMAGHSPAILKSWSWDAFKYRYWLLLVTIGWGMFCAAGMLIFLRASAYLRDNYRASSYAVPDLIEFFRRLNRAAKSQRVEIELSIIGHSIGAFVATNVIRTLTDVFEEGSIRTIDQEPIVNAAEAETAESVGKGNSNEDTLLTEARLEEIVSVRKVQPERSRLGPSISLNRLVMVSPDIPALAAITGRANFLGPSILRCNEACLFSNGGDVVLSLISQGANYMLFPAKLSVHAARLGNIQVRQDPGVWRRQRQGASRVLRIGGTTLLSFEEACSGSVGNTGDQILDRFSFIDCTGLRVAPNKSLIISNSSSNGRIGLARQLVGLGQYVLAVAHAGGRDCHSGYFADDEISHLIFATAAKGLLAAAEAAKPESQSVEDWVKARGLRIC